MGDVAKATLVDKASVGMLVNVPAVEQRQLKAARSVKDNQRICAKAGLPHPTDGVAG